ncbi:hypothetical protein [Pseudosulfitobacter sp. SM2401]|uniref:hypothetical protein n=1 Tax=Pseudosulfitobacter sp. SM2401 TaxID=3350098 RepID=UPI0036F238CC
MPQADLNYSSDLTLNAPAILAAIESTIAAFDGAAGACKGRAHKVAEFHHTHVLIKVSVLEKPHRDTAFMNALAQKLETAIKAHLHAPCAFSLALSFLPNAYITNLHRP